MCGIFAYVGATPPSRQTLAEAVRLASRRGPHGHGWASAEGVYRALGPLDKPEIVGATIRPEATWVLGHSRLATYGMPRDESGLQPVTVDGHTLIHNGNVTNWRDLHWPAPTDSWAVGQQYASLRSLGHGPLDALDRTLAACQMKAGAFVVRDATGPLLAFRKGLPIHALYTRDGLYLSSGSFLHSHPLPEGRALTLKDSS